MGGVFGVGFDEMLVVVEGGDCGFKGNAGWERGDVMQRRGTIQNWISRSVKRSQRGTIYIQDI